MVAGIFAKAFLLLALTWAALRVLKALWLSVTNPLRRLRGPARGSFFKGHFEDIFNIDAWSFHQEIVEKYGSVVGVDGPLWTKSLFVHDPKAMHHIFVKDCDIFEETPGFIIGNKLSFGNGIFSVTGDEHRKRRKMLNPTFSIKHLKDIIPIFWDVASQIDMLSWMSRTALELIGQSGFGYSFDPLTEGGKEHVFSIAVRGVSILAIQLNFMRQFVLPLVHTIGTPQFRRWVLDMIPWKPIHEFRDVLNVTLRTAEEIVATKKEALVRGNDGISCQLGHGKDIMSNLLKANMEAEEEDRLPDDVLVAQVCSLTFAAMDTTSNALARTLHLLSQHPDQQEILRQEIKDACEKHGTTRLGYDELVSLPYLNAVCRETLRLYSPVHTIVRETCADAILPFSRPILIEDGSQITELMIPKGTNVLCSLMSSNRNPEIWGPDSLEWKPERWIEGLPDSVVEAKIPGVYSHLMTFIAGGRSCIGFKFSQLEMKVVLCALLCKFKLSLPKDKELKWRMTGIATPAVEGRPADSNPELPLIIEAV